VSVRINGEPEHLWRAVDQDGNVLAQRPAQFAAGFGVGTTTAYRYITEAVELLAALALTLAETFDPWARWRSSLREN
jgi:hypothetical protein